MTEAVKESLLDLIKENCGLDVVTPEMTFAQLGMDSLDYILLIKDIREKIGPIGNHQAQSCEKVSDLLAVFNQ